MNYLWPFLIIISFIFAILTGNIENLNNSIYSTINELIKLIVTLLGNMCLWCGIINIIMNTSLIDKIKKILNPLLKWLYKEENNANIMDAVSVNTISNIIGIGNAATPAGLKAMEIMQNENINKQELTNSMIMLIVLNTTSMQIIPTTVLSIRASLGSINPSSVIIPIWISTFMGTMVGIFSAKIICRRKK